jgi:hypothetical protein
MIQFLKLVEASAYAYRMTAGGAVKLKFERDDGYIFGSIHNATDGILEAWKVREGEEIAVKIQRRRLEPDIEVEEACVFTSFRNSRELVEQARDA